MAVSESRFVSPYFGYITSCASCRIWLKRAKPIGLKPAPGLWLFWGGIRVRAGVWKRLHRHGGGEDGVQVVQPRLLFGPGAPGSCTSGVEMGLLAERLAVATPEGGQAPARGAAPPQPTGAQGGGVAGVAPGAVAGQHTDRVGPHLLLGCPHPTADACWGCSATCSSADSVRPQAPP